MTPRFPLSLQLLACLAINVMIAIALFILLPGKAGLGWNLLLSQAVRDRLAVVGDSIARELTYATAQQVPAALIHAGQQYGVHFTLREPHIPNVGPPPGEPGLMPPRSSGSAEPGSSTTATVAPPLPPPGEQERRGNEYDPLRDAELPPGMLPSLQGQPRRLHKPIGEVRPPADSANDPRGLERHHGPTVTRLITIDHRDNEYRIVVPVLIGEPGQPDQHPLLLIAHVTSVVELLRFLAVTDWALFTVLLVVLSALLWTPFAFRIVRSLRELTAATHTIANGRFNVRVREGSVDELGELGASVNRMAQRLDAHIAGQRQFMADIAHEIISPLARMQIGLGMLQDRFEGGPEQGMVEDVLADVQHMGAMLDEVMLFSRAGVESTRQPPEPVLLRDLVASASAREGVPLDLDAIPEDLQLHVPRVMLERAIGNVLRNAHRHAPGSAVDVRAEQQGSTLVLWIGDRGPGVPDEAVLRLGEPFFRPDVARSEATGGVGLGLAIVRRCTDACGGEVIFRNREGGGFEAELRLPASQ